MREARYLQVPLCNVSGIGVISSLILKYTYNNTYLDECYYITILSCIMEQVQVQKKPLLVGEKSKSEHFQQRYDESTGMSV